MGPGGGGHSGELVVGVGGHSCESGDGRRGQGPMKLEPTFRERFGIRWNGVGRTGRSAKINIKVRMKLPPPPKVRPLPPTTKINGRVRNEDDKTNEH